MLTSLALIFLLGMSLGALFQKLKLPPLVGMLLTGLILGSLKLLSPELLSVSADLRQLALIIILTRAGLALNIHDLKKAGRPALLLCFLPACLEIAAYILLAPALFHVSLAEAAVMGAVLAAVSPAVIVPKMLKLMESEHGGNIPGMIMAGAAADDIFVILLFTSFTGLTNGNLAGNLARIPVSILTGLFCGLVCGLALTLLFKRVHMRDSAKVIILLSISFLLVALEKALKGVVPLSGLLAVIGMSATVLQQYEALARRLSGKFSKLWVAAEIVLFVLVGAAVDLHYVLSAGMMTVLLILAALLFRMAGVFISMAKSSFSRKQRLFCALAYIPKGTVQAAIGAIPLSMGMPGGQLILTAAVLSVLITAPLGALGIDLSCKSLLSKDK